MLEFKNINKLKEDINKYKNITRILSIIRLISLIIFLVFVILLISQNNYFLYGIISFVLFIYLISFVFITNKYYIVLKHLENKLKVYNIHLKRRELNLDMIYDDGSDFIKKDDYKSSDLDLFGKHSLFKYLNSTKTKYGRNLLKDNLLNKTQNDNNFSKSILELGKTEDTIDIEASLQDFKNDAKKIDYDTFNFVSGNKIKLNILSFIPLISFILTIVYLILIFTIKLNPYYIIIFLVSNLILSKFLLKNDVFNIDSMSYSNLASTYIYVIKTIKNISFKQDYLNKIKDNILKEETNIKSLRRIYLILSIRYNMLINILLNTLFSFDFFIILLFNNKTKKMAKIEALFENVGILEVLISFSNIAIDNDIYTTPLMSDTFEVKDMYHPLVKNCVKNDFKFSGGIILTGSNMSGKTTFMRMIGINMILANCNSLVFASYFKSPILNVYTSLRCNDMLKEGISTFYAEILRMKLINQKIEEEKCLILIDEIFKGTNAVERIQASFKIIEKFNLKNVYFIISTHDFDLCSAKNILNYHFEETYDEANKISFDYKIKEGISESKNALYLLKMANII